MFSSKMTRRIRCCAMVSPRLFECHTALPLTPTRITVADIRARLEVTEQRLDALRANGAFSPVLGGVRLRQSSNQNGTPVGAKDEFEFSPLRCATNANGAVLPTEAQQSEQTSEDTADPLAGSTELENAKLALKRMEVRRAYLFDRCVMCRHSRAM